MRTSLISQCKALCILAKPGNGKTAETDVFRHLLESWHLSMQIHGLPVTNSDARYTPHQIKHAEDDHNQLLAHFHASLSSGKLSIRRVTLQTLSQLVASQVNLAERGISLSTVWRSMQHALSCSDAAMDVHCLSAALQLAGALICLTYFDPHAETASQHPDHAADNQQPNTNAAAQFNIELNISNLVQASQQQSKRAKHVTEEGTEDNIVLEVQGAATNTQPASSHSQPNIQIRSHENKVLQGRPEHSWHLTHNHAVALHDALVGWAGHWHHKVRRLSLSGLISAHGGNSAASKSYIGQGVSSETNGASRFHQPTQHLLTTASRLHSALLQTVDVKDPEAESVNSSKHRLRYLCSSPTLVEQAYAAAVAALRDDMEGVRCLACQLIACLATSHPSLTMPGPRWLQLGQPQQLLDDAFQRLCACVGDGEANVRVLALQLLAGLPSSSLRVKLQALSKKATISVATTADHKQTSGPQQQQKQHAGKAKGNQGSGNAGSDTGLASRAVSGFEPAWCGGPGARGLPLLDASIGALVHGTEDEDCQVRAATTSVLLKICIQELAALQALDPTQQQTSAPGTHGRGSAASSDAGSRREVVAQSTEYLCDLLQDEDESVRLAALSALTQIVDLPGTTTAAQPNNDQQTTISEAPSASPSLGQAATEQPSQEQRRQIEPVIGKTHILAVLSMLLDPHKPIRHQANALLSSYQHWSVALVKALVAVVVQVASTMQTQQSDVQEAFALVRTSAGRVPTVARTVATLIAKQQQQQKVEGVQAGQQKITRQHLLVMQALIQGAGGLQ